MAVYIYDQNNPHPSGFHGIRVSRSVSRKVRQRYFSFRRNGVVLPESITARLHNEAHKLDAQWKAEQRAWQAAHRAGVTELTQTCPVTKVRGIRYASHANSKGKQLHPPYFEVSVTPIDGKRKTKRFSIPNYGYKAAWKAAVDWLAQYKPSIDRKALYRKTPALPKDELRNKQ